MNFWRTFGINSISVVETILEKDDFTLEELMDEEDLIQECKSENQKLIDFLVIPSTLEKLFDYITVQPPEDSDSVRCFKYPFIASEILCSDSWAICDAIYDNKNLLDKLYGFLDNKAPLNDTLATHVSKVAASLLDKKAPDTLEYLRENNNIVNKFIEHLKSSAMMDLLLKIIASSENDTLQWLCELDLIPSLVSKFKKEYGDEIHENAAEALADIIQVSSQTENSPLLKQIESEKVLNELFGYMFEEGGKSSLYHGLEVIIELVKRNVCEKFDSTTPIEKVPTPLYVILKHLDSFKNMISKQDEPEITMTTGKVRSLGFKKLKIVQFCAPLFATNYKSIGDSLMKTDLLQVLLSLFFEYEWNNFLHIILSQMIYTILDGEDQKLKEFLVIDAQLASRIVNASKLSDQAQDTPRGFRKGYMGFVTNITFNILNASKSNEIISNFLQNCSGWNEYINGSYHEIKSIESSSIDKQSSSGEDLISDPPLFIQSNDDDDFNFGDDDGSGFSFGDNNQWIEEPDSDSSDSEDKNQDLDEDN
eukprot:TRINITY_DN5152_c0_g1_i1.p1 TRINITY_DN5152_c0_g1~~TRINITY_DN5152_c0_g1_i1.p1  ORF type:complete len:536 (-),score=144.09 TRINITY_DN5152_c0_g1_i1:86-1693(-)